jgi:hypothetical protein
VTTPSLSLNGLGYPSLAIDGQGTAHIGYIDQLDVSNFYRLRHATRSGGLWTVETADSADGNSGEAVTQTSLALDGQGAPSIGYVHQTAGTQQLSYASRSGGAWTVEQVVNVGSPLPVSLKMDGQGYPHIGFITSAIASGNYPVRHATGTTGSWSFETVDSTRYSHQQGLSLVMDASGNPRMAYQGRATTTFGAYGRLRYAVKAGGTWTRETVDSTASSDGWSSCLALDAEGEPRIAYSHSVGSNGSGSLHYADAAVHLLAPSGGESWLAGSTQTLRWAGIGPVAVEFSSDGGTHWSTLIATLGTNTAQFTVPSVPTAQARMRIRRASPLSTSASGDFAIQLAPGATWFGLVNTGELFVSTDQGATWVIRTALPVHDAVGLAAGATQWQLYLASASGSVYRSADAGNTWSAVGAVPASDVVDVAIRPDLSLLLLTRTGSLYRSTDEGATFSAVASLTGSDFVGLAAPSTSEHYALAGTGEVWKSGDGGTTWTAAGAIAMSDAVKIRAIHTSLFVMSSTGDLWRSVDSGTNWTPTGTLSQSGMTSLAEDGANLVAATGAGEVASSPDGTSWTWRGTINQLTVRALGTDRTATTSVEQGGVSVAGLAFSAPRPNPGMALRGATFSFKLEGADVVSLVIHDVSGRVVARRDPESFPAGPHAVAWAPRGLHPGLYFVRLATLSGRTATTRWAVLR